MTATLMTATFHHAGLRLQLFGGIRTACRLIKNFMIKLDHRQRSKQGFGVQVIGMVYTSTSLYQGTDISIGTDRRWQGVGLHFPDHVDQKLWISKT